MRQPGRRRRRGPSLQARDRVVPPAYRELVGAILRAELAWLPVSCLPWGFATNLSQAIKDHWIAYWVMEDGSPAITLTPWSCAALEVKIVECGWKSWHVEEAEIVQSSGKTKRFKLRVCDYHEDPSWTEAGAPSSASRIPRQSHFADLPFPERLAAPPPACLIETRPYVQTLFRSGHPIRAFGPQSRAKLGSATARVPERDRLMGGLEAGSAARKALE
jgi:hypothetical protein